MPALGAPQTPTALRSGDKIAVLNDENLAGAALTMAVAFTPQPMPVVLAIVNQTAEPVALVASADLVHWYPVTDTAGTVVSAPSDTAVMAEVASGGLFYAITATGAITAGTVWLAR
jgi:hypothetical protein